MKQIVSLLLVCLLWVSVVGCTADKPVETPQEPTASSQTAKPAPTDVVLLKQGVWEAYNGETKTGYYYFSATGRECKYKDADLTGGVPFDYEVDGAGYLFHIGAADDRTEVSPEGPVTKDTSCVTLIFADRRERLEYKEDTTLEAYTARS